jgi:hypothetical protein
MNGLDKKQKVAPLDNDATSVIATEIESSVGSDEIKHLG